MLDSLPPGEARSHRPASVVRYTYEDFEAVFGGQRGRSQRSNFIPIVPIEAMEPGDVQVIAAREPGKPAEPLIDLGVIADVPSVESLVVSTRVVATRELPGIRELLLTFGTPAPAPDTLRKFTGLVALHAHFGAGGYHLDLECLPARQMRKLAVNRWFVKSFTPLQRMNSLVRLSADFYREPLDAVAGMHELEYLRLRGPAKGWAKLRDCEQLKEAHLIEVRMANLHRWNTWSRLRKLTLTGRGVKSLSGLESCRSLEQLTLINLKMNDLAPLRELPRLTALKLRMADIVHLSSVRLTVSNWFGSSLESAG